VPEPSHPLGWHERLREDLDAAALRDPAACSRLELLLCHPGLHAAWRTGCGCDWAAGCRPVCSRS